MSVFVMPSTTERITIARPCPRSELQAAGRMVGEASIEDSGNHHQASCTCIKPLNGPGVKKLQCSATIPPPAEQCEVSTDLASFKDIWYPAFSGVPCALGYDQGTTLPRVPGTYVPAVALRGRAYY